MSERKRILKSFTGCFVVIVFFTSVAILLVWITPPKVMTDDDANNYLINGTPFEIAAKVVLPENKSFSKETKYFHVKYGDFECIKLTLYVDEMQYEDSLLTTAEKYKKLEESMSHRPYYFQQVCEAFVYNGHEYLAYTFVIDNVYYAVAYSSCAEKKSVEFIFFSTYELSTMSAYDALITGDVYRYVTSHYDKYINSSYAHK